MTALTRKLLRDVAKSGWQYTSVGVMVALGVAFLIGAYSVYENLKSSYATSYDRLLLEDFGVKFRTGPERLAEQVWRVGSIEAVEGRLVKDAAIDLPGPRKRMAAARLVGLPAGRHPSVNQLRAVEGRPVVAAGMREALVEASFASHHNLHPGSEVTVVYRESEVRLRVAGIVQSCEYLYVVRSKQELFAVPESFGVLFVPQDVLASLLKVPGQINELRFRLQEGSNRAAVMAAVRSTLSEYEPEAPIPREDQPSYQMLEQDVQGFQTYAVLFPLLFLSVAAVATYSVLTRVVHVQRPVIGLLRSLGFSSWSVTWHYMAGTAAIGAAASVVGAALGVPLGSVLSRLYMSQLQVPYETIEPRWTAIATGIAVGLLTCVVSGIGPALAASRIPPAEAMRPLSPTFGRRSLRLDQLIPRAPLTAKIPLRNVFRQPKRTVSTLIGVVAGLCLMMTASGLLDSMEIAMSELMRGAFRCDLRVDFVPGQTEAVLTKIRSWRGVNWAEAVLELPVELRHGGREYSALLSGVPSDSRLRELRDSNGRRVRVVGSGAVVGPTIKKKLDLEIGDTIELKLPEEFAKETTGKKLVRVAGFTSEAIGTQAYLPLAEVQRLFSAELGLPANAVTGVQLLTNPEVEGPIRRKLESLSNTASVLSVAQLRAMVNDLMNVSRRFVVIMQAFGLILGFAVIFNMVTVNVLERSPEAATMRTLGVSNAAVAAMVFAENFIVVAIGVAIGLPVGRQFVHFFWQAAQTEQQQELITFEIAIRPTTYWIAAGLVFLIAALSQVPALRYLSRLNLAHAVKERST